MKHGLEGLRLALVALIGFYFGLISTEPKALPTTEDAYQEISLIRFSDLEGDSLSFSISGPARVIWGSDQFVENDGEYLLPLGQFSTELDNLYQKFNYLGNAKTGKYYPTSSYPARGTEVRHRRFFQTRLEAESAGFIASKLVK